MSEMSDEEVMSIVQLPLSVEMRILLIDNAPMLGLKLAADVYRRACGTGQA